MRQSAREDRNRLDRAGGLLAGWIALLLLFPAGRAMAQVNVQVVPAPNGCKGAIVYNNSNHVLDISVGYIYEGRGGSYYSGRDTVGRVPARSSASIHMLFPGPVDCSKPYTVRTNYTYQDITAREQSDKAERQRQADLERRRREEYQRDQQRRRAEADARKAREAREREARMRKRDEQHKREYEAHQRRVQQARNKPGIMNCPKGKHC